MTASNAIEITCDTCGLTAAEYAANPQELRIRLKRKGWTHSRTRGGATDTCPHCQAQTATPAGT